MTTFVNFDRLIVEVETLKEEAKLAAEDGDYEEAIELLEEAVGLIDESGWDAELEGSDNLSVEQKKIAFHLADCLGMMGGNYRRLDRLAAAVSCFQRGRKYEEDPRFEVDSSYNLVNAIALPIESRAKTAAELKESIGRVVKTLERQIRGKRRIDRWAWADLGECRLLLGDFEGAKHAYNRFIDLGDPGSTGSAAKVLRRLEKALAESEPQTARTVGERARQLEERASSSANR